MALVGVGESIHKKPAGLNSCQIALQAIEAALADAQLEPSQIDGICYGLFGGQQVDADAFRQHFGVTQNIWESQKGGAMVWAGTAPLEAARALKEKKAKYIINSFAVAWASERSSMVGGPGESHAQELFKQNAEVPFGWFPQPVYFATVARRHMIEFATTPEELGAVAVTQRAHANLNPAAIMYEKPLSMQDYLDSPAIADPFRKEDCCLISDGGAAYIMTSPDRAKDLAKPPVQVAGVGLGSSYAGTHWAEQGDFVSTPQIFAAPKAFEMAKLIPSEIDVLCVYDPFTIVALMQIEDMGFCNKGDSGVFALEGNLTHDSGILGFNTHGGLLSHSYVLGIAHVVELVRQLRGEACAQVKDAKTAAFGGFTGPQASTLILRND